MANEDRKKRWADKARNAERSRSLKPVEEQCGAPPPYDSVSSSAAASPTHTTSIKTKVTNTPAVISLDFTPIPLELPAYTECIAHLKLLHAFAKLRREVGNEDGLFGIELGKSGFETEIVDPPIGQASRNDSHQPQGVHDQRSVPSAEGYVVKGKPQPEATLAERICDKRWVVFVSKAADRFEMWWESLPVTSRCRIRTTDFDSANTTHSPKKFTEKGEGLADMMALPPLDVLMVWHSYLLNPRTYLEDCIRHSKHTLWQTPFPWKYIFDAIDGSSIAWDWRDDDRAKTVKCPGCCSNVRVPYTRADVTDGPEVIDAYLSYDTGYAGQAFQETCQRCGLIITHEKLRVGKFIADANDLLIHQQPLPGTILNSLGKPEVTKEGKRIGTHDPFFPSRVVERLYEFKPDRLRADVDHLSMEGLKTKFQDLMAAPELYSLVNLEQYKPNTLYKESKIAVRKMLSHYWDNSSPFGLDLVGAVLRQGSFVQKTVKIDWLHSPAVAPTMLRLIVKYHRFIRMIADWPKRTLVPTLDVDLAWHTHQLTPKVYYAYTVAETKKFVNHDDKIPEESLHANFQWTSRTYEKKYGQPYSECACWYCECTREPLRSSLSNRINPFRSTLDVKDVAEKVLPSDPVNGPHVSAHNALIMSGATSAAERRLELHLLDLQYIKVQKRYQKSKRETPSKDNDAYIYSAYGYPIYYPVYVPYYADPTCASHGNGGGGGCTGDGGGGWGTCVPGTCSEGASMGSCAVGSGVPTCAASCGGHGDAGGGCGS
ncbi:hypothetical protein K458DRAFT_434395 [Lentithecium fluviatile CBS 122367]|uniref:Uncharacterized protein n=1 Tax=Lentithecium fluviatile CBS 122367 TaxID=1168545 RepID=A0A6G1IPX8_9PLEO|nr:hypothetical protein K458DRAFT_434395 [Lentithecium fluviatile CBS 122367]